MPNCLPRPLLSSRCHTWRLRRPAAAVVPSPNSEWYSVVFQSLIFAATCHALCSSHLRVARNSALPVALWHCQLAPFNQLFKTSAKGRNPSDLTRSGKHRLYLRERHVAAKFHLTMCIWKVSEEGLKSAWNGYSLEARLAAYEAGYIIRSIPYSHLCQELRIGTRWVWYLILCKFEKDHGAVLSGYLQETPVYRRAEE